MGIWTTMTVFETYANVMRLGVVNGMNREIAYILGTGNNKEAESYAQTTLAYSLFTIIILWLIIPFLLFGIEFNTVYLLCIGVNIIRVTISFYTTYLTGTFRTSDNFNKLSNIQFVINISHLILCVLVIFWGFHGYLLMQLLLALINGALLHFYRPFKVLPNFNKPIFFQLIKVGFPLFLTSYAVTFIDTFPRLFIINYGNEVLIGYYAPVIIIINAIAMLPNAMGTYYYPKFSFQFGQHHNPALLFRSLIKIYIFSIICLIPVVIVGYFILDEVIKFFPKYQASLPYLKISLVIAPFVMAKMGNLLNVVLKKVKYMGLYVISYALFQIASIAILYNYFTTDILACAVWSQIITSLLLFATNLFLNYHLVKHYKVST